MLKENVGKGEIQYLKKHISYCRLGKELRTHDHSNYRGVGVKGGSIRLWVIIITLCSKKPTRQNMSYDHICSTMMELVCNLPVNTDRAYLAYQERTDEPERAGSCLSYYSKHSFMIRHPG